MCRPPIMTDAFLLGLLALSASVAVLIDPLLATRGFEVRWRAINCTAIDVATTAAFHCLIVELPKRQGNFLNTRLLLKRPVPKMWVEMSVGQIGGSGSSGSSKDRTVQTLFRVRVDACHLIGFRSKNRILNAVLGKLLQSGNYPKTCPLLGNVNYTSTHFALNPDHFPAYMPDMKFNTKLVFYLSKNITLIRASVDAEVLRRS